MRYLYETLYGATVGFVAAGIASLLPISPYMMFGAGMLFGSLAQLVAHRVFPDRTGAPGGSSGHPAAHLAPFPKPVDPPPMAGRVSA